MVKTYNFTIEGNQDNKKGNPLGYHRTTQGSYWNAGSRRYSEWKDYVVSCFCRDTETKPKLGKPIEMAKGETAEVNIAVEWANDKHSDLDNCLKGILDALFANDKYITYFSAGSRMSKTKAGIVTVHIDVIS